VTVDAMHDGQFIYLHGGVAQVHQHGRHFSGDPAGYRNRVDEVMLMMCGEVDEMDRYYGMFYS